MYRVTRQQYEELKLACERAEGPGACEYVTQDRSQPKCVAAQYLAIRGISTERIAQMPPLKIDALINGTADTTFQFIGEEITRIDVPASLIRSLQHVWDDKDYHGYPRMRSSAELVEYLDSITQIVEEVEQPV